MTRRPVEVWWGWRTPEDQTEIKEIFSSVGIEAEPKSVTEPSGGEPGIIMEIVVGGALVSFFHGYFEAAGRDAWEKTKQLVEKTQTWFTERHPLEPPWDKVTLIFRGRRGRTVLYLDSTLPEEAFRALAEMPLRRGRSYRWDHGRRAWVSKRWLLPDRFYPGSH